PAPANAADPANPAAAQRSESILREIHAIVAAYEGLVRRYAASGYADDALWHAGLLSLDAFHRFEQPQDRTKGVRLLHQLEMRYPTSRFAKRVREALDGIDVAAPRTNAAAAGAAASNPAAPAAPATAAAPATIGVSTVPTPHRATLREVRRTVLPDVVRVTMELDSEVAFHEDRLSDPARVFLDLSGTRAAPPLLDQTIRFESDDDVLRQA